ncbi:MAG: hypothetical protein HQL56_01155 [Magnetococcales bacterium]|nr:hypothetical protein [Magnetococcales bacterium]
MGFGPSSTTTTPLPAMGVIASQLDLDAIEAGYIADQCMPPWDSATQAGQYPVFKAEAFLKRAKVARAMGGVYSRGSGTFTMDDFSTSEKGREETIDDRMRKLYANMFNSDMVAVKRAMSVVHREREVRVRDLVQSTTAGCGTAAVGTEWSSLTTSSPKADVLAAKESMLSAGGLLPNAIVMTDKVFNNVCMSTEFKSSAQYTTSIDLLPTEAKVRTLATYFDVEKIIIARPIFDAANEGQDADYQRLWSSEYVSLLRVVNSQDIEVPQFGRRICWSGEIPPGGNPQRFLVETYREEQTRSDVVRVREECVEKVIYTGGLYVLSNITA